MGEAISKMRREETELGMRTHVEAALAFAGPYEMRQHKMSRICSGLVDTIFAIWRGRSHPLPRSTKHGRTVMFTNGGNSNRLLVVSPPLGGNEKSANVKPLVNFALSRGWNVAVHARERDVLYDEISLRECIERARSLSPESSHMCVIGLSVGAYDACKAALPYPLVSISNGYDLSVAKSHSNRVSRWYLARRVSRYRQKPDNGELSCVQELANSQSPTLLINSRNDPLVPGQCLEIGDSIARRNAFVASVTAPRGGHLGFIHRKGRRWAYDVAMEFLESVVRAR